MNKTALFPTKYQPSLCWVFWGAGMRGVSEMRGLPGCSRGELRGDSWWWAACGGKTSLITSAWWRFRAELAAANLKYYI